MRKILATILFLFFVSINCTTFCASSYLTEKTKKVVPPDPIFKKTVLIPQGQVISVYVRNDVSSETAVVVDEVNAVLKNDFYYNGKLIAQEGSSVSGMVTKVSRPTDKKPAELLVKFTGILTPKGENIPISAVFSTYDKSGIIKGENGAEAMISSDAVYDLIIMQPVTYIPR